MKIYVEDELILELSEVKKKVLCNDIFKEDLYDDLKRRLTYIIMHKYGQCLKRLKDEWIDKLKERGVKSIPLDDEELAELIFKQKDYKDRSLRDKKMPEKIDLDYFEPLNNSPL